MFVRFLKRLAIASSVLVVLLSVGLGLAVNSLGQDLPDLAELERIRPKLTTVVYSADGQVLKTFSVQRRELVPYEEIPEALIDALMSKEDRRFWSHWGVNPFAIIRAAVMSVVSGRSPRGTSTVTQQLARDLFLTRDYTLTRKAKEAILAVRIERTYTKAEILQMYLNQVFWGGSSYGVQAASRSYFGCDAKDLNVEQCATLVGLLPAPNKYDPLRHPHRARQQRNVVLMTMEETGRISHRAADSLRALPVVTSPAEEELGIAPYFTEYIRINLADELAESDSLRAMFTQSLGLPTATSNHELIYEGGLSIETTLDSRLQSIAERVLIDHLDTLQTHYDWWVANRPDSCAAWIDSSGGEIRAKRLQAALVAMDAHTGAILAMVGGRDFDATKFNRAVQALRQPGSAFKPFVYTAAMDNGFTPASQFLNQPITVVDSLDDGVHEWRPENFDHSVGGLTTLRDALRHSTNLVAIRLLNRIGPRLAVQYAHYMGITSRLPAVRSLALGVGEVRLMELTSAYGVFPNGGILVEPYSISRITSRSGVELIPYRNSGVRRQALNPETAFIMTTMLKDVVQRGTGGRSRWKYRFWRPAGGKTGTTNDNGDAWFMGFTPQIVCGVWVGFDQRATMAAHHTGSGAALPIWARFMKAAHDTLGLPELDFERPEGVAEVELCNETHQLATRWCPGHYTEYFREGQVPPECETHSIRNFRRTTPAAEATQQREATPEQREPSGSNRQRF